MTLEPWQDRVVEERDQLKERLGKLSAFIHSEKFDALSAYQQLQLTSQEDSMAAYLDILEERVKNFDPERLRYLERAHDICELYDEDGSCDDCAVPKKERKKCWELTEMGEE